MNLSIDGLRDSSVEKLSELKNELKKYYEDNIFYNNLCVYVCGSLGRLEMTAKSDLDLFFITMNDESDSSTPNYSNLDKYTFFANLYKINQKLEYHEPSKRGLYWDFISKTNLLDIGSRQEDYNNSFTARMLLILESKPLLNDHAYELLVEETIMRYFIDYQEHKDDFHPLFLMNDILRYWYTLTLNYEYRRDPNDGKDEKNWKRLKLKYPRLLTCFSMLACLYKMDITPNYVIECVKMTPCQRLRALSTNFNCIQKTVEDIEKQYEWFVTLRQYDANWWHDETNKSLAINKAEEFHDIIIHDLMKKLSHENPTLRQKTDIY